MASGRMQESKISAFSVPAAATSASRSASGATPLPASAQPASSAVVPVSQLSSSAAARAVPASSLASTAAASTVFHHPSTPFPLNPYQFALASGNAMPSSISTLLV